MENPIERAVNDYKPVIAAQYSDLVHRTFEQMVKKLGPTLKGIYNDRTFARMYSGTISAFVKVDTDDYRIAVYDKATRFLDEDKVAKAAALYSDRVAESLLLKINEKVGVLDAAEVKKMSSATFLITGTKNNHKVTIEQTMILNFSKLGTIFNQFPARIYVDGKFMSAAKFKTL